MKPGYVKSLTTTNQGQNLQRMAANLTASGDSHTRAQAKSAAQWEDQKELLSTDTKNAGIIMDCACSDGFVTVLLRRPAANGNINVTVIADVAYGAGGTA